MRGRKGSAMPIIYPHKTEMPCADPAERRSVWDEVALGYTVERALVDSAGRDDRQAAGADTGRGEVDDRASACSHRPLPSRSTPE